jgi:alkylation response protein AidB-like acyl-CoA dehydrogenase
MFELCLDLMGQDALTWLNEPGTVAPSTEWVGPNYNYLRAATIYAGSNEIQKNIIAKLILGLPS